MSCYSLDLRERVIKYLKKGNSKKSISRVFQISTRTVYNWEQLDKKGSLKPKKNIIRKPKKINQKELEIYITKHPEKTLYQIASFFKTSHVAIFNRIKKASITYKKKNFSIKKEMKK